MGLCDAYNLTSREFYFDRSPKIFENILGLYRKGELHLTESVCPRDFLGELDYWGLSALHLGQLTVQWWIVQCTTPTFHLYNILIHTLHTAHQTQTFANIFFEVKGTKSYHWFSEPCCAYTLQDNQCETEWNHIFNWEASATKNMSKNMSGVRLDSVPHLDITESLMAPANSRQRHWRVRGGESKLFFNTFYVFDEKWILRSIILMECAAPTSGTSSGDCLRREVQQCQANCQSLLETY